MKLSTSLLRPNEPEADTGQELHIERLGDIVSPEFGPPAVIRFTIRPYRETQLFADVNREDLIRALQAI